jgi:hypothetical protein
MKKIKVNEIEIDEVEILRLSNLFISNPITVYELEKMTGISSKDILSIFRNDLYSINEDMATRINKILDRLEYENEVKYFKELVS